MSDREQRYEYRLRLDRHDGSTSHTPWLENPITDEVLLEWRHDMAGCGVFAERREVLYGEPEDFLP